MKLEINPIQKFFGESQVLKDVSFEMGKGKVYVLMEQMEAEKRPCSIS